VHHGEGGAGDGSRAELAAQDLIGGGAFGTWTTVKAAATMTLP